LFLCVLSEQAKSGMHRDFCQKLLDDLQPLQERAQQQHAAYEARRVQLEQVRVVYTNGFACGQSEL
jgi:hypothetical protein